MKLKFYFLSACCLFFLGWFSISNSLSECKKSVEHTSKVLAQDEVIILPPVFNSTLSINVTNHLMEDTGNGIVTITADVPMNQDTYVDLEVTGTATMGLDYVRLPTQVLLPAGQDLLNIPITVIADSQAELAEEIIIRMISSSDPAVSIGNNDTAIVDVQDNDSAAIVLDEVNVSEDDGTAIINARLTAGVQNGFSVDLNTLDGSATVSDNDYQPIISQTIQFSGQENETISITLSINADGNIEGDETFLVVLDNLQGTAIPIDLNDRGIVTIINDDVDCSRPGVVAYNLQTFDAGCSELIRGEASVMLQYDGFESVVRTGDPYTQNTNPIPGLSDWRYETTASNDTVGLVISYYGDQRRYTSNGSYALLIPQSANATRSVIWTVDLAAHATDDDLALSFSCKYDERRARNTKLWIRGEGSRPWVELISFDDEFLSTLYRDFNIDIDSVLTAAGQFLTSTTEIKFEVPAHATSSGSFLIDDVGIYKESYDYLWSTGETDPTEYQLFAGDHSVTITTPEGCSETVDFTINPSPHDDASISFSTTAFCYSSPPETPVVATPGGYFFLENDSPNHRLEFDPDTGRINFQNSDPGSYRLKYFTNGACPDTGDVLISIYDESAATFSYPNARNHFLTTESFQIPTNRYGGTFSSTPSGLDLDPDFGDIYPSSSAPGVYQVTYTLDSLFCGASSTQTISISNTADTTPPSVNCQPYTAVLNNEGMVVIDPTLLDNGSTDNMAIASMSTSPSSFSCSDIGVQTVTLTVTDTSGNSSSCDAQITVVDTNAPDLICENITLELNEDGVASLDNYYNNDTIYDLAPITFNEESMSGATQVALQQLEVAKDQPIGFDFEFFGETYSTFNIAPAGFISFGFFLENNRYASGILDGGRGMPSNLIALAWVSLLHQGDNNISYKTVGVAPDRRLLIDFNDIGSQHRSDKKIAGQIKLFEGSNRIELHLEKQQLDIARVSQGITNRGGGLGYAPPGRDYWFWSANLDAWSFTPRSVYAEDGCGTTTSVSQRDFSCSDLGPNVVNISSVDSSGNADSCSIMVTVVDNILPQPVLPELPDVISDCAVTSLTEPSVTDNCSGSVTVTNDAVFPITSQGTTRINWVYDDGNGNFNFQSQNVIINDVTPPTPLLNTLPDIVSQCSVDSVVPPLATEALCDGNTLTIAGTTDQTFPIVSSGTHTVIWSFEDQNGNISTQNQDIVISDTQAPSATCPNDLQVALPAGTTTFTMPDYMIDLNVSDNCDLNTNQISISQTPAVGTVLNLPVQTSVSINLSDSSGNTTLCEFDLTVDVTASISEIDEVKNIIHIYPNPTSGLINIESSELVIEDLILYDINGRIMKQWLQIDQLSKKLNISNFGTGIYYLRVKTSNSFESKKIIIR